MPKFRHKLYPQPLVYTNHGPALFADHHFETDDAAMAAELAANPEIEVQAEAPAPTKKARSPRTKKDS